MTNTASNSSRLYCHHPNGPTNTTLVSAFYFPLWVGMTVAKYPSPSVSTYFITPFPSSPCTLPVSLICFIPSNLASAVPSVPLLAVFVLKIVGCVCLRVSTSELVFIQSDVVPRFLRSSVYDVFSLCVCEVYIRTRFCVSDGDWTYCCWYVWLLWVCGSCTESPELPLKTNNLEIVWVNNKNGYFGRYGQYNF